MEDSTANRGTIEVGTEVKWLGTDATVKDVIIPGVLYRLVLKDGNEVEVYRSELVN